jgi:hypothetical protein
MYQFFKFFCGIFSQGIEVITRKERVYFLRTFFGVYDYYCFAFIRLCDYCIFCS